jgi:formylglycine-generating enzyme required for sulfatase activity/nucleotide-binding universal stress UspA family protein
MKLCYDWRMNLASVMLTAIVAMGLTASAQDTRYVTLGAWQQGMISPPPCLVLHSAWEEMYLSAGPAGCPDNMHELWLSDIRHWRDERKIRVGYDGARYALPALQWAQSSFIQPQTMVHDRFLYDPASGKYTVDRYVADLDKRYGGVDAVLIWPTYPNMGIDNRNQQDMIRSMPGGVAGVKQMVADFHRHHIRVLFPMMMWDQGTRDPGEPWPDAIAKLMKEIDADGINGDTQDGVPYAFSKAADTGGHPLAFEPEGGPADEALAWNVLTWGQYHFQFVPSVDRYKWLESRHMVNISDRWNRNKNDDLQFAFFNGVGWESWENIWGIWNGITQRDAEATRRMATIEREIAPFLVSPEWEPLYPMHLYGIYASRWPLQGKTVWTIVNRNEYNVDGPQISVPWQEGTRYFDLYHGVELSGVREGMTAVLSFPIEAHGFGAVLALQGEPDATTERFLATMKKMTASPLAKFDSIWRPLPQQMVDVAPTPKAMTAPAGMVLIPSGDFVFKVKGIEIEGEDDIGVDMQYPWEDQARRFHEHPLHINSYYIDKYPVTNAQFKEFLDATHYHPSDDQHFLQDWKNGTYPEGWANKPVTWVALEDARAYAKWAGKRLPREWEWQYAAQGTDSRLYPWGNRWDPAAVPVPDLGRTMRGPDDVSAHPAGNSPLGVGDLVGNVWQWTDEFVDEHTRTAIVRGGSYYRPQGSIWYFPQAYSNDEHGKLLLMAPGMDRSAALGFRCVKDAGQ